MATLFKSFPANLQGVDYICSDIHGNFSLLEKILREVGFDRSVDRLFSLGDLIDRGPESERALEWLAYEWFFAIQGNHERMLVDAMEGSSSELFMQWKAWGGAWVECLSKQELEVFYEKIICLPVALELTLSSGNRVGLVHAELPDVCNWDEVRSLLETNSASDIDDTLLISGMLWSKSQAYRRPEKTNTIEAVKNIDHVFHGHTIVDSIITLENRTFMDLGSYLHGDIGVINPVKFLSGMNNIGRTV